MFFIICKILGVLFFGSCFLLFGAFIIAMIWSIFHPEPAPNQIIRKKNLTIYT